jgi:hypothetical protein
MTGIVSWIDPSVRAGERTLHGVAFAPASDDRDRLCAWLRRHGVCLERVAASLPVRCRRLDGISPTVEGWTADLAGGGCALFLPERLPVGALLEVVLSTPAGEVPSEGVVVWEGRTAPGAGRLIEHGFRFTRMRPGQEGLLRDVLAAIHASRAPGATAEPVE